MSLSPDALALMREINLKHGSDSVVLASDMAISGRYTTGSLSLDVALGGGWPANQWCEIVGHESAGKTACVFKTVAANQKLDPNYTTFWLAAEKYDEQQATALGVDNSRVLVSPTQKMEDALSHVETATASKAATCIVLDSYPALLPDLEAEKEMGETTVAVGARLMNKWVRKIGHASKRDVRGGDPAFHGIIINQYRDKIGGFAPNPNSPPETTPGGNGKNYLFQARIKVERLQYITEKRPGLKEPVKVGQGIRFTCFKNKSASPQGKALVDYYFKGAPFVGFSRGDYDFAKEYVEMGKVFSVIQGRTWLTFQGERFNGKPALEARFREDIDFKNALRNEVLEIASDPKMVDQVSTEQYLAACED
jgi:recombination protein RecA